MWRNPEGVVNFQAVKDLQTLASAAALKGQASASKWLSARTRLPRRPRPLHPLFHHLLDVKSSPEPTSVIILTFDSPSPPSGVLEYRPHPAEDPLGDQAERIRLRAEAQEEIVSHNLGFFFHTRLLLTPSPARYLCTGTKRPL